MGKRDTRYSFMNPIAAARARGPPSISRPSIRDYLSRERPSWEEVKGILQKRKEGSSTLAAWEEKMNEKYRKDLAKNRKWLMREDSKNQQKQKEKRKKKKKRSPSMSSLSSSGSTSSKERNAHKNKHRHKKLKKSLDSKYLPGTKQSRSSSSHKKHQSKKLKKGETME